MNAVIKLIQTVGHDICVVLYLNYLFLLECSHTVSRVGLDSQSSIRNKELQRMAQS
jgi:hypothetical protein